MSDIDTKKQQICEIGKRVYAKDFAAANEGNLSIRIDDQQILCTPTLHCKGFLTPADICTVDIDGNQVAGEKKCTSEILLHLEIYRRRPDVNSVVHCHPPHATAFAVAREPIPTCILPEPDIFLGEVPIAPYATPGTIEFARTIIPFVDKTNTIILANHGAVSYAGQLEQAYWFTEILDAYCRILILANQLGDVRYLSLEQGQELLKLRQAWGYSDPRSDGEHSIADFASFKSTWPQSGLKPSAFAPHPSVLANSVVQNNQTNPKPVQDEAWIDLIAKRVVAELRKPLKD